MLHAIGVELPRQLLVHGWWLAKGGEKMSKSLGNAIHPIEYGERYGSDAFRYFVLREMNVGQDSNFSHELFVSRYQSDLANDLGNLLSRLVNMVERYGGGSIPPVELEEAAEVQLKALAESTIAAVRDRCGASDFSVALERIFALIREINRYLEGRAPWKLAKSEELADAGRLRASLGTAAECLRICAILLLPTIPAAAEKILLQLGATAAADWRELRWGQSLAGRRTGERLILFPRIEEEDDALSALPE
jgi:methionyl-tRNA synthetase